MRIFRATGATCATIILALSATGATAARLSNGTSDGKMNVEVNASGGFGDANYNPIGSTAMGDTTYASSVYFRAGNSGARTAMNGTGTKFVSNNGREAVSTFAVGALKFTLTQSLSDLRDKSGAVIGSVLTQSYDFVNSAASAIDFSLSRYIDGQMGFEGASFQQAGGGIAMIDGTTRAAFETLRTVGLGDKTIFLGITAEGGNPLGYDVDRYTNVTNRLLSGNALGNDVLNDADGDGLVDAGKGFDTGLALENGFSIAGGGQGRWTTRTLFGTGPLGSVTLAPPVPEPATWAMMIAGFGLVGAGLRRQSRRFATA